MFLVIVRLKDVQTNSFQLSILKNERNERKKERKKERGEKKFSVLKSQEPCFTTTENVNGLVNLPQIHGFISIWNKAKCSGTKSTTRQTTENLS